MFVVVKEPPPFMPPTMPVADPTEPLPGLELVQVPPAGLDVNVIVEPTHTISGEGPLTGEGNGSMVTTAVTVQPVPNA